MRLALPLIGIAPRLAGRVDAAWSGLARQRLVVFVSPNAADSFMARRPAEHGLAGRRARGIARPGHDAPAGRRRRAARGDRRAGRRIGAVRLGGALGASRRLDWQDAGVLLVRGDGGRAWLADRLTAHGASVAAVAAYRRVVPGTRCRRAGAARRRLAAPGRHLWLFGSSEAIDNLQLLAGAPRLVGVARAGDASAHRRARPSAPASAGCIEARPTLAAATACIQSLTV